MATQLVKGNTAVVIGALYAGCDSFFGYPITPASEILHEASRFYPPLGRKFLQAESEEASINMCYGAAAAGHRVFTASSGPGISLMQEGVSYLAGAELPTVIVDIMRAGPGLGRSCARVALGCRLSALKAWPHPAPMRASFLGGT